MTEPGKQPKPKWRNSTAKLQLERDLILGDIPLDSNVMHAREVYRRRDVFLTFPYEQFRDRLREMRNALKKKQAISVNELAALQRDRLKFPLQTHNANGKRRWAGSPAEHFLKIDMKNGLHEMMAPRELRLTRPEYVLFDLDTFRGHIHQEKKSKIFRGYVDDKKTKKQANIL